METNRKISTVGCGMDAISIPVYVKNVRKDLTIIVMQLKNDKIFAFKLGDIVYGPVNSRRLFESRVINLTMNDIRTIYTSVTSISTRDSRLSFTLIGGFKLYINMDENEYDIMKEFLYKNNHTIYSSYSFPDDIASIFRTMYYCYL